MEPLDLKEFIEVHTLLSNEYRKCPLSAKDLKSYASSFAELLRVQLRQCLENGERRQAANLILEIQASMDGIEPSLLSKLHKLTLNEMRLFNREWNARHPPRPCVLSKAERQKAASTAYAKMMRSMGH